jgi:hypothetical protein
MNHSLFWDLVRKDLGLYRMMSFVTLAIGAVGVFLLTRGPLMFYLGCVAMLCAFIIHIIFLVGAGVITERKERVHHFVLSLPITGWQYTLAKITALSIAFFVPFVIVGGTALLLMALNPPSRGFVPYAATILMYMPLYFAMLVSVSTSNKTEGPHVAVIIFFNIAINFLIPGLMRIPSVAATMGGTEVIWTPELLLVIAVEIGVGALTLVWMLWRQHTRTEYL